MDSRGFENPSFRTGGFLKPIILDRWIFKTLNLGQIAVLIPVQTGNNKTELNWRTAAWRTRNLLKKK
ncbi:hypothetical protein SBF1_1430005 [Candidatus Desulfosporosinus infrequens]|uniref:Uncharacterized protein n=1 Tax=Candidatus Desulfosporosinus infrequens TaxID=2043169 RepID=A0A2U3K5T3_9FIRM|nr:hypothetical protein SBF1_1430005 [Candidatus Desulfosporosinus infrequens]